MSDISRCRRRIAAGAGLSLGAALGVTATAQAADFTVDRLDDPGPSSPCLLAVPDDCSLRQAIGDTQNSNGPIVDRVLFQAGLSGTITLSGIEGLRTTEPLDIVGPGARVLSVTGDSLTSAIVTTEQGTAGDPVNISGLTLTGGNAGNGNGGGIYTISTNLTIDGVTISHNQAGDEREGGGIEASGNQVIVRNSTISNNDGGNGGGIHALNTDVGIETSTISGNTATGATAGYGYGGGIWLDQGAGGSLVLYGSTIAGNHAHYGGGISAAATTMGLGDSVVANNTATAQIDLRNAGPDKFQLAHSLVESPAVGSTVDIPLFAGSNILGVDPQLGSLADNGGPTQTEKPSLTSPLLDKGRTMVPASVDQRGLTRPFDISSLANTATGDASDIGAVELQASDFPTTAGAPPPPPVAQAPARSARKKCKKSKKRSAAAAKKCKKKRR
jgi:hypothetical protein